jgi:hypothetical protein
MRFTSLITLLPALALAQEQVPLADRVQGWFNKAKNLVPTAVPADPIQKMAEKVSEKRVTEVTMQNWQSLLTPAEDAQDWYIYVTGGNKTCFGRCDVADKAFKVRTSPLLAYSGNTAPWNPIAFDGACNLISRRNFLGIRPPLLRRSHLPQPWSAEL